MWRCLWMTLTVKFVDWVKQITVHNVRRPHPIRWRPEQNKKADPSPAYKREFFLPNGPQTGTLAFSYLCTQIETLVLHGSQATWVEPNQWHMCVYIHPILYIHPVYVCVFVCAHVCKPLLGLKWFFPKKQQALSGFPKNIFWMKKNK